MYVPKGYRPQSPEWALEIIRAYPIAILVGAGDHGPLATHLPVIVDEETLGEGTGETGLTGVTVFGHLNRMNPHWRALADGDRALLIFQGHNGYVSPTLYETTPAAPTWNFTSVHVHGSVHPFESREETLKVVRATAETLEGRFGNGWDTKDSLSYFDEIVSGVGAFSMKIDAAEGMFKLSQEKTPDVRARVADSFANSGSEAHRRLAEAMRRLDEHAAPKSVE